MSRWKRGRGRQTLYYQPRILAVSLSLALLALVFGAVGAREIPTLLTGVNAGGYGTPITP